MLSPYLSHENKTEEYMRRNQYRYHLLRHLTNSKTQKDFHISPYLTQVVVLIIIFPYL